jgi:serine/threonine protein kinase
MSAESDEKLYNGRYKKIKELGEGSYGKVFSVMDTKDKKEPMYNLKYSRSFLDLKTSKMKKFLYKFQEKR